MERSAKLIILDSIAYITRVEFDSAATIQRQNLLSKIASTLKNIAECYKLPVLISNQITTVIHKTPINPQFIQNPIVSAAEPTEDMEIEKKEPEKSQIVPSLGIIWSHSINTRLVMDFVGEQLAVRRITVAKSPIAPVISLLYTINGIFFDTNYLCFVLSSRLLLLQKLELFWTLAKVV